jgi:predicted nuclease of predicted toxin-antitoxin system
VKLLLDENLSPRLVPRLASLFSSLIHVRDVGLRQASDETIWRWARLNGYTVVTTDADFVKLSGKFGWPPRVIHIERCDFPFRAIEELLRKNGIRISEFGKDPNAGLLLLQFSSE